MSFKEFYKEEYGQKRNMIKQVAKRVVRRTKITFKHRADDEKFGAAVSNDAKKEQRQTAEFYKNAIAKAKSKGDTEAVSRLQKKFTKAKSRWSKGRM